MTQPQLQKMLFKYLIDRYGKENVIFSKDYLLAEGDYPVMLVAHMDTVGSVLPSEIYFDPIQEVMWSPWLLGADDRAGIYAIMQLLEKGYRPSVLFTTDEEMGGIGAQMLTLDYPTCPLKQLHAIIELAYLS